MFNVLHVSCVCRTILVRTVCDAGADDIKDPSNNENADVAGVSECSVRSSLHNH